ncbi:hypothetical protein C5E44_27925 [Nocardia nova]|nr:hypothetical protein C5E44_27925 [Nocardia nova]
MTDIRKRIAFLTFGYWQEVPGSTIRTPADAHRQTLDLAQAADCHHRGCPLPFTDDGTGEGLGRGTDLLRVDNREHASLGQDVFAASKFPFVKT